MSELPSGTVTFLFTDTEGSTRRWEEHPAVTQLVMARQEAIIRHFVATNGGYVYKRVGNAFQAAFPTAPQALQAAIDAQRALHSEKWPVDIELGDGVMKVRMSLHTAVTEERGGDYTGPALNRVARLLSAAHGGQVLLSEVTNQLVQDAHTLPPGVQLLDMGEHRLKDLTRPEHIFQLEAFDLPSQFPPLNTLDNQPNNLPLQPTPLIGREKEVREVEKLLLGPVEVRLLTLTGPGGTGKTRLALQVGAEVLDTFPDGVWLVELAALTTASLVASTIAQTLGVREATGKSITDTLKDYVRDKGLLLVLDNFEHVLDAVGVVSALLSAAPHVKILVTSRAKLNIYGEHEYPVPPLSLPDATQSSSLSPEELTKYEAVHLFKERAQSAKADFQVNKDNALAVAEICARLDGLPLAIELAAARVKVLPPQALLARLSSNLPSGSPSGLTSSSASGSGGSLKLLTGGDKDLLSRQQTLRNTIDWSYNLLSAEEKQLFRRVAVFQGGFTLEVLEELCNAAGHAVHSAGDASEELLAKGNLSQLDVLDGVQSLVDKSLLRQREKGSSPIHGNGGGNGNSDEEPRFFMLETIHEYAREKLQESGEAAVLRKEHALYFMRLAEEAEPRLAGKEQQEWLDRLEDEHDNLRAALRWAREGQSEDESEHESKMEAVAEGKRVKEKDKGQTGRGKEKQLETVKSVRASQPIEVGLRIGAAVGRFWQVRGYLSEGREQLAALVALLDQETAESQTAELVPYKANALHRAGVLAHAQGDYPAATTLYQESLALRRELGDKSGIASSLNNLGVVAQEQGDYATARTFHEESLALKRELGDKLGIAYSLTNLGTVAKEQGAYAIARSLHEESLKLFRELGDRRSIASSLTNLGVVAHAQEDYKTARSLHEESLRLFGELGDRRSISISLNNLGTVAEAQGDFVASRRLYEESLVLCRELGDKLGILSSLAGLGGLTLHAERGAEDVEGVEGVEDAEDKESAERGARVLGAVEALSESMGAVLDAVDRAVYERNVAVARTLLSGKVFEKAWEEGRAMSMEEVIEYALERGC